MAQPPITRRFDRDVLRVAAIASAVSLLSVLYYFQRGQILLYGDAVAHINIARRVFDSQTPGLLQLGTVWLPLPHLLMIPFLVSDSLWQSGLAGSIPSMIAYVLGVAGVFRLARRLLTPDCPIGSGARVSAWVAALVYAANPNLIYLQTTAMTESLYVALFVWAAVYFGDSARVLRNDSPEKGAQIDAPLLRCGLCLAAAELTRYDGWFLAAAAGAIVSVLGIQRWQDRAFRRSAIKFLVIIAAPPLIWLAYNAAVYGNPLEFANGPYSARAIQERSTAVNPAARHVVVAASYFLKSAELNMTPGNWGRLWLVATVAVFGFALWRLRALALTFLLLCLPIAFYAFSIAYGGIPLYIPSWWPFTWYNIRYGLQLLPLFAVSAGLLVAMLSSLIPRHWIALVCALGLVLVSYASVWRAQPLCLTEALVNSRTRIPLERAVANAIQPTPRQTRFLMYLGNHVAVFQQAGIPLRQVVNEGNHRPGIKPSDPEGLWERALADPPRYVDYVIAFEGDPVDRGVSRKDLKLLSVIHTTAQPPAFIYGMAEMTSH
jgi:hypothetical protein